MLLLSAVALAMTSATALAASGFEVDCDGRDNAALESMQIDSLNIAIVDLATGDDALLDDKMLTSDDLDGAAPILNLGPRVASIVENVFAESTVKAVESKSDGGSAVRGATLAPLAGSNASQPTGESVDKDDKAADGETYSPLRIHHEMYRTDI